MAGRTLLLAQEETLFDLTARVRALPACLRSHPRGRRAWPQPLCTVPVLLSHHWPPACLRVACCLARARAHEIEPGQPSVLRRASDPRRAAPALTSAWVEGARRAWLHHGTQSPPTPGSAHPTALCRCAASPSKLAAPYLPPLPPRGPWSARIRAVPSTTVRAELPCSSTSTHARLCVPAPRPSSRRPARYAPPVLAQELGVARSAPHPLLRLLRCYPGRGPLTPGPCPPRPPAGSVPRPATPRRSASARAVPRPHTRLLQRRMVPRAAPAPAPCSPSACAAPVQRRPSARTARAAAAHRSGKEGPGRRRPRRSSAPPTGSTPARSSRGREAGGRPQIEAPAKNERETPGRGKTEEKEKRDFPRTCA
jgi:hypothetical protein